MKKKLFALALSAATAISWNVFAENPKAEEYRAIFDSGTYYVEYRLNGSTWGLAVKDGTRTKYRVLSVGSILLSGWLGQVKGGSSETVSMYSDGKYYYFLEKKKLRVVTEEQLKDENLNPNEGWEYVQETLMLPQALEILAPNDAFNRFRKGKRPQFTESGQQTKKDKVIDYDRYVIPYKTKSGHLLHEDVFYFYYQDGDLKRIEVYYRGANADSEPYKGKYNCNDRGEWKRATIKIKKITQELPKDAGELPDKCKIYSAGLGDMNDLLGRDVLLEEYKKPKEAK